MTSDHGRMASKRVLVVEDDYFIAKDLVRHLRAAGAEVVGPVATVADALSLVRAELLDGAVLDINLQNELVFPVADVLVERGVSFVFASGYSRDIIPARYASITLCEKPVNIGSIDFALFIQMD